MEGTIEVDVRDVIAALLRRWWLILICLVTGAALMLGVTACMTPQYTASVYMYVDNSSESSGITSSELTVAKQLVNTCINIIKRDLVLIEVSELVQERTGRVYSPEELRAMLAAESVDSTELFTVRVTNSDPEMAAQIANAVAEVSPDLIAQTRNGTAVRMLEWAKTPKNQVAPNYGKNMLLGATAGVLLSALAICLLTILDKRIKSEEELTAICNAPVLGNIPDFLDENKNYYRVDDDHRKPVSK